MSNPFSRGSLTTFPDGPGQVTDNLTALPNGFARGLGAVQLVSAGAPAADCVVAPIQIKSGTGTSGTGNCALYIICSEDNTIYDSEVSPGSTSDQSGVISSARLVQPITVSADATLYAFNEFSVWSKLGFIPTWFTVVVYNQSGAALDVTASNFSAKYAVDSYT
jgi:hypothetical protein